MTASPAASDSSHDSGDEHDENNQASKGTASKDRECQYCHQKFTSSSLGRHLDQFLHKKKPDGIHNVDEIRRLRGGITRRTARNSQKKEQDESLSTQHSPSPQYTLPSYSELLTKTATTKDDVRFNRPHWHASGVITDPASLNAPTVAIASPSIASPTPNVTTGQKRNFSTYAADVPTSTNSETLRALELSLREVLDAVRTATTKASPPSRPFDFDIVSQTFPFLCLALLPVPPTLFQSTPFSTATSIPLSPPGPDQYQALHNTIANRVDSWKRKALAEAQRAVIQGTTTSEEHDNITESAQMMLDSSLSHLEAAYQNFMSYNVEARHNLWSVELLRALKAEQDKVTAATAQIDRMVQEANQLQQQLDHLSMCQWPREMALWPPDRPSFHTKTQDELRKLNILHGRNINPDNPSEDHQTLTNQWDYDRIVSKWRKQVREDRARRTGVQPSVQGQVVPHLPGQSPLPPPPLNTNNGDIVNSPISTTTVSTPRIASLNKSTTDPITISNHNPPSRPGSSLAMTGSGSNDVGSPTLSTMIANAHLRSGAVNGIGMGNGHDPTAQQHGINQRRRIGILSDVDEHYGPRLAGLRRDR